MKKVLALILVLLLCLTAFTGCGQTTGDESSAPTTTSTPSDTTASSTTDSTADAGTTTTTNTTGTTAPSATQNGSTAGTTAPSTSTKAPSKSTGNSTTEKTVVVGPTVTKKTYAITGTMEGADNPRRDNGRFVYKYSNGQELAMFIQQPITKKYENAPFIVQIQGGGWCAGEIPNLICGVFTSSDVTGLLESGWALVTLSYRGVDNGEFLPEILSDIMDGIGFLQLHQKTFHLDCERVIFCGCSAPAHVSLMMATAPKSLLSKYCVYPITKYKCIGAISINAPAFLYPINGQWGFGDEKSDPYIQPFGSTYEEDPDIRKQYSPATHLSKDSPPLLLFYGTKDDVVDPMHTKEFAKACEKAGAPYTLVEVVNGDHGIQAAEGTTASPTRNEWIKMIMQFATDCLTK